MQRMKPCPMEPYSAESSACYIMQPFINGPPMITARGRDKPALLLVAFPCYSQPPGKTLAGDGTWKRACRTPRPGQRQPAAATFARCRCWGSWLPGCGCMWRPCTPSPPSQTAPPVHCPPVTCMHARSPMLTAHQYGAQNLNFSKHGQIRSNFEGRQQACMVLQKKSSIRQKELLRCQVLTSRALSSGSIRLSK